MKTSARNQFSGTVLAVKTGAVNSEISIGLPGGQTLTATVTNESCQELALAQGRAVIALVKSSHIIVATDLAHIRLSARNQIEGIIEHIERGAVNALVSIKAAPTQLIRPATPPVSSATAIKAKNARSTVRRLM